MRVLLASIALIAGCVSTGTYNKKVAELTKVHDDDAALARKRQDALQAKLDDTQHALDRTTADKDALQKSLDEQSSLVATLRDKLEKLGQNVDGLVKERGQLNKAMADTTARLEELRKQEAAAEARAATFRSVVAKLHSMIDSGQLKVAIRDGRMIIALPNDILFDSGRTEVKKEGKDALAKVAQVLAGVPDRAFLVGGHTDNVPIHTELFPSNWELSTRRAVEVVHLLIADGMSPKMLAAAGYGEFDPVAPNDTADHRAQNRRIEVVLQPNLSELPSLDDVAQAPQAKP